MKKIVIMMAVAFVAFVAPAATVSWTMTNVYGPDGSSLNSGTAYMFGYNTNSGISSAMIASAIQGAFRNNGVTGVTDLLANNYSWIPSNAGSYSVSGKDPVSDLNLSGGTTYAFYTVVFDQTELTSESKFFISEELANKKVPSGDSGLVLRFGDMTTSSKAEGAWVPIPEPTSGLLMLLGMAGLALKRKHV